MALKPMQATSKGSGDFEVPPEDNHGAFLVAIVDLGTQKVSYQGTVKELAQVYLCWELTNCPMSGMKDVNHVIGKAYTLSLHVKSGLYKMIHSWRGQPLAEGETLDLHKLFGVPCLVNVTHSPGTEGRVFAKMADVSRVPKNMKVEKAKRPTLFWEIETGDLSQLDWLPWSFGSKISDLVQEAPEWKARQKNPGNGQQHAAAAASVEEEVEQETPF